MILGFAQQIGPEFLKLIAGAIFLIIFVVRKIFEANKNAGVQQARPPMGPAPQPQVPKAAAPVAGQQADPLRAQVEEFLRRAGRPPQAVPPRPPQRPPQPAPASEIQVLVDPSRPDEQRTIGQPLRQAAWRNAAQPSTIAADKASAARKAVKPGRRQSVAEHVAEQVTAHTRTLADNASQLGQRIAAEDQLFDVQLKAKFDHNVGTLAGSPAAGATEQTTLANDTPAAQLAAMLASPSGIRQAVLVNEILRRPSDRW